MAEITLLTGSRTSGDILSTSTDADGNGTLDGPLFVISARYRTAATAVTVSPMQSGIELIFQDGGSIYNFTGGNAIHAQSGIRLTVNEGSTIASSNFAVNMASNLLRLDNFGIIISSMSTAITGVADGSSIDNYGEISSTTNAFSGNGMVNNHGTIRAGTAANAALNFGNLNNTLTNHGTIFGQTNLDAGTDTIFNAGTMRGQVAIEASVFGGNKTITNTGFIGTTGIGNDAIALGSGDDIVFNFGSISGTIHLGGGTDAYQTYDGAMTTSPVFGEAGQDNLIGNGLFDYLDGGDDNDSLSGNGGDDVLVGALGADSMSGGTGDDTFFVENQADAANEAVGQGRDTVLAFVNYTLAVGSEVELLINNTAGGLALTGNEFGQTIYGSAAGNDTLAGGGGADTLNGQGGNDTYNLGASTATIVDSAGASDLVTSTITRSLAPFAAIENLTLLGSGNGTGNALANVITGSAAANNLDGGLGNDTLLGLAGNDTLIGHLGKDMSTGGAGNDVFRFAAKTHSLVGANADVITDFDDAGNDRIDVSALFGPAMTYRHNLAFTAAGQVRINDIAGADIIVEVNTSGSLAADFAVRLTNTTLASMNAGDFVL